jgi:ribosomal protein S18 acetylase RimI-like enzyme
MKKMSELIKESVGYVGVGCQSLNSELIYLTEGGNQVGSLVLIYNENTASIFSVEVLNKHRGKGYGKKLVVEAISRAKSKGSYVLELNTETDNTVANNLYQSLGFELRGLKDDFNNYIKTL